jgi:hypothetical protein
VRYTNEDILKIFKGLGRFEHPLINLTTFHLDERNEETRFLMETMTHPKPNVILELLRDDMTKDQQ